MHQQLAVSLEGQVAIITGGTRGLGRAYALDMARHGAAVVVNSRPGGNGEEIVAEVVDAGGRAAAAEYDVTDPDGAREIVETARRLGRVGILVNNAGILGNAHFEELTPDQVRNVLSVHLAGAIFVAQCAFKAMREYGYGRIVNVSSPSAFGMAGMANYAAAKAGVFGLTATLALEGAPHGIKVNSVLPNGKTTLLDSSPIPGLEYDQQFIAAVESVAHRLEPELNVGLVTFLCSAACEATGQHFSSLGGRYARVFYGVTEGWMSPVDSTPCADDVAEHFGAIADTRRVALLPTCTREEVEWVGASLAGARI